MERVELGPAGNGKSKRNGSDFEVKSVDLAVEYSQAKPNLCPATDVIDVCQNQEESKTPEELYQALSDKNRAIELLKRRLTNQQIQLGYYLHKNLATEAVLEFSNKCIPQLAEDSTQLSLAMYKFIRDSGGKTRLAQLREKLADYNNRVHKALLRQEQLIRQGFGFDEADDIRRNELAITEDDVEYEEEQTDDIRFAKKYYKSAKLEMCSQLLGVTLQVRNELEQFRICAENVVKLEEERNALVDRVFSLPAEQRYGNLRISMVDNLRKHDSTTSVPSMTSVSTNTTAEVEGKAVFNNLGGVLHDMESEAIELLLLSEKQKNEFVIALEEARLENQHLKERLRDLEEVASDERVIELQRKCVNIEKEVEGMRRDLEAEQNEKEEIIKQMGIELEKRDANEKSTKIEMKKLKATVELLRNERENLQKKLEATTRQYIRQMHQNTSTDDMLNTKSEDVSQQDVEELTDLVVLQEEQIKDLLSIMSEMNENDNENDTVSTLSTIEKKSPIPFRSSKNKIIEETKMEFLDSGVDAHPDTSSKDTSDRKDEVVIDDNEPVQQQEEYQIYYDSTSEFSNQDMSEDGRMDSEPPAVRESKQSDDQEQEEPKSESNYGDREPQIQRPRSRSLTRRKYFAERMSRHDIMKESRRSNLATTSLRVQAFDKDGKSESMHAVLECTSPVDGLLEMNNSSKLHLRLQCTSPQRHSDYPESRETSTANYSDKDIPGDHRSPDVISYSNENRHLSRDARLYLSKQLNKIKSRLQTSRSSSIVRKEIVQNLNEIYSQLFGVDDDIMTQSTRS